MVFKISQNVFKISSEKEILNQRGVPHERFLDPPLDATNMFSKYCHATKKKHVGCSISKIINPTA